MPALPVERIPELIQGVYHEGLVDVPWLACPQHLALTPHVLGATGSTAKSLFSVEGGVTMKARQLKTSIDNCQKPNDT